jgi:hypothetical protein
LKSTGSQGLTQKLALLAPYGTKLVTEVECGGKKAHDGIASAKGMAMHTTTIAKIAARIHSTRWSEGLPRSLPSFLTVPPWALDYAIKRHSKTWSADSVLAPSAPPFAMLVASDVSKKSYGLVP